MIPPTLVILGFGGHARSVADIALSTGIQALVFVDPKASTGEAFHGFAALTAIPNGLDEPWAAFPAVGDNAARARQIATFAAPDRFCTLISPRAYIGTAASIGRAVLIAHNVHIGPAATIGDGCIVNTGAVIDHECRIGRYSHVSVNTTVAGRCTVGERVFLGAGSTVRDGISIGDDITVGIGAAVVEDLREPGTYVGVPARRLRS